MSETLSLADCGRLAECEAIIEKNLQSFIEVGNALLEIRDSRLYRKDYGTFEDYCRQRWDLSKSYAYRLIEAAEFSETSPMGDKPKTERKARAMIQESKAEKAENPPNGDKPKPGLRTEFGSGLRSPKLTEAQKIIKLFKVYLKAIAERYPNTPLSQIKKRIRDYCYGTKPAANNDEKKETIAREDPNRVRDMGDRIVEMIKELPPKDVWFRDALDKIQAALDVAKMKVK